MKHILFIVLMFCLSYSNDHVIQHSNDYIINNFENWNSYGLNVVSFKNDSINRNSVHFFQIQQYGYRFKFDLHIVLNNKILLPYRDITPENAQISVMYRSENLRKIGLVFSLYDENENEYQSDTLFMSNSSTWNICSTKFSVKGCRFFHLSLYAKGIDSTYSDKKLSRVDSTCAQNLWIGKIKIKLNDKDIGYFSESDVLGQYDINYRNVIPINNDSSFFNISELKEKKIIAIGESLHGSETFNEIFYRIIKHQVEHNQCKLILLELDIGRCLLFNRFIHGDENLSLDSLLYGVRYTTYSYQQLKNIMLYLKNYNKTAEKKVWLMGLDLKNCEPEYFPSLDISEYLYYVNTKLKDRTIDTICYELITSDMYKYNGAGIKKLRKDTKFHQYIGDTESQIFTYCCNNSIKFYNNEYNLKNPNLVRDKYMYENAKYFINLICGKDSKNTVLVYGHIGHINYNDGGHFIYSFGHYMKEFYKQQYYGICLTANDGDFFTEYKKNMSIMSLKQDYNSLEHALSNISNDCFYIPVKSINTPYIKMRNVGNEYKENHFSIIKLANRFDAIIYEKEIEAAKHLPNIVGSRFESTSLILERSSKVYDRIKQRIIPYK